MILTTRPASREEVVSIASRLRGDDRREIETASGMDPETVLLRGWEAAGDCYTFRLTGPDGRIEQDPAVLFGVTPDPRHEGMGIIWLVATPEIRRAPLSIIREAAPWLAHWTLRYPCGLHNMVDVRNDLHVRWLRLLGFRFDQEITHNGHQFHYVTLGVEDV